MPSTKPQKPFFTVFIRGSTDGAFLKAISWISYTHYFLIIQLVVYQNAGNFYH